MAESVDARDLKSLDRKVVWVQVPLCAPKIINSDFVRVFVIMKTLFKRGTKEMIWLWIIIGIVVLVALFVWVTYNGLVTLRVRVDEAWSDINVQLKRRLDLIPNLVETVKGYAKHEKGVFEAVTEARSNVLSAKGVKETAAAENQFEQVLKSLFAVAEAYPDLKASQNFVELQQELVDTEDKIQASRRFYNGGVRDLNTKIQTFPANVVAAMFSFKNREFFEVGESEQAAANKPTDVKF
jgi:LemA protein